MINERSATRARTLEKTRELNAKRRQARAERRRLEHSARIAESIARIAHDETTAFRQREKYLSERVAELEKVLADVPDLMAATEMLAANLIDICARTRFPLHTRPQVFNLAFEWLTDEYKARLDLGNLGKKR